jgi:hypothetical protein
VELGVAPFQKVVNARLSKINVKADTIVQAAASATDPEKAN